MNHGEIITLEKTSDLVRKVGEQKLVLHLREPLGELPERLRTFEPEICNGKKRVVFTIGSGAELTEIIRIADSEKIAIEEVDTCRTDLEDVFLRLTGNG